MWKSKLIYFLLFACTTRSASAQAQLQWLYTRTFNQFPSQTGNLVVANVDQSGGIFFTAVTDDSTCSYNIGQLSRVNEFGNLAWRTDFFYETPCAPQHTNSLCVHHAGVYLAVSDSSGHMVRSDTSGGVISITDTTLNRFFVLLNQGQTGDIVSAVFPQANSSIISHDSLLNVQWTYTTAYPFFCDYKKILCDKQGRRIALFNYNDNSQTEVRGIGLIKLDTNGILIWDTFINPQTAPTDPDWCVDAEIDQNGNIFVLSEDHGFAGAYLHKVDAAGNIVASAEYVIPSPLFDPKDIELDTVHGLVYVTGRTTGTLVRLKYDFDLNPLDTVLIATQQNGRYAQKVNEFGYIYHLWIMQNATTRELRLDMYNHGGQLVDSYDYWDSTRFIDVYPEYLVMDTLGNIFAVCNGNDTANNDVVIVFKFANPLDVQQTEMHQDMLTVFPNPAADQITISVTDKVASYRCNIYTTTGERVHTNTFTGTTYSCTTEQFTPGLYLVEVINELGLRATQKLIIQR